MNDNTKRIFFGALLVLAGAIFLLQQVFDLPIGGLFIGLIFAVAGAAFLFVLFKDTKNWWAAIPGFTLLGLGALIASSSILPGFSNRFGGSLFLGAIALSFIVILLLKPSQWWAVIPGGVLTTLAVIAGIPGGNGMVQGSVFFLGTGATFAAVGLLPVGRKEKWPWIPAGICLVIGTLILIGSGALIDSALGWIWAVGFIALGSYLVVRSLLKKNSEDNDGK